MQIETLSRIKGTCEVPLYEYRCKKCGHKFEKIQKFSDPPVKKCPDCGGAVEQLISSPAVQFKGSGWYVTDYARKSNTDKSASSSDSGKDSKPAEKSDSKTTEKQKSSS
jgi:putative FmdB family regulatory protein